MSNSNEQMAGQESIAKTVTNNNEDFSNDIQALRIQVIGLFPDMKDQIKKMTKKDLQEIFQLFKLTNGANNANNPEQYDMHIDKQLQTPKKKKRSPKIEEMIKEIAKNFPDMSDQFEALKDHDVIEIYEQLNVSKRTDQARKKQVVISTEQGQDVINPVQMKKQLIDRLPEFKNQIRNLPDDEIVKMYTDLQEEQNKNKKKSEINSYKEESKEAKNGPFTQNSLFNSKRQIKQQKKKYKCKIVLYLDAQDFNYDTKSQEGRRNGLTQIMEALSRAFQKK